MFIVIGVVKKRVLRKHSEATQPPLVFAHKYFGKTSTRKLFICESKPSKPIYQILICENNLACSEINLTANEISPINHYPSTQGISHPITLTLYLRNALYTHTALDAIASHAKASLFLSENSRLRKTKKAYTSNYPKSSSE